MRRIALVVLFLLSSVGIAALPAGADLPGGSLIVLSFDFSDNSQPAAVSNGAFNIIADVLPEHNGGFVRMVAIAPDNSGDPTQVCPFQAVQQSQVECAFNFSTNGVWTIKAQFAFDPKSGVDSMSVTRLRVAD